jgi:hypothetical protein
VSDHIVNANKMVSDTPRTDETWKPDGGDGYPTVDADFARQLERELNAANSKIKLLMSANADVARIAGERDAAENRIRLLIAERDTARRQADQNYKLREEFRELLGTDDVEQGVAVVREMKERIKRLEETLHRIANADYRGHRSTESQIAFQALTEAKP